MGCLCCAQQLQAGWRRRLGTQRAKTCRPRILGPREGLSRLAKERDRQALSPTFGSGMGVCRPCWHPTTFSTGSTISTEQANYFGSPYGGGPKGEDRQHSVDVGTFKPNGFALFDVHGNVSEWVQDCYKDSYESPPTDGSPVPEVPGCSRVWRGGNWASPPAGVRSASRGYSLPHVGWSAVGFRVARELSQ
jgi:hypothetical protein